MFKAKCVSHRFTIRKMERPSNSPFLKAGKIFYRVKSDGVYMQDFKTKQEVQRYIARKK